MHARQYPRYWGAIRETYADAVAGFGQSLSQWKVKLEAKPRRRFGLLDAGPLDEGNVSIAPQEVCVCALDLCVSGAKGTSLKVRRRCAHAHLCASGAQIASPLLQMACVCARAHSSVWGKAYNTPQSYPLTHDTHCTLPRAHTHAERRCGSAVRGALHHHIANGAAGAVAGGVRTGP